MSYARARGSTNGEINKLLPGDQAVHGWYRFVLSFPPHLVREYVHRFGLDGGHQVLDPFCGTGTTIVECKKLGIPSVGIEANPMAHFASQVKVDWSPDPDGLIEHARHVARFAAAKLESDGLEDISVIPADQNGGHTLRTLRAESLSLLLKDSISPLPLHKTLVLLDCMRHCHDERYYRHELLALAKALTTSISNLHFGPEVGVGPAKLDAPVIAPWLAGLGATADDLLTLRGTRGAPAKTHHADSRDLPHQLEPDSIDAVITSPPYPNEKDYTRITRLESVLLGFICDKADLRALRDRLVRSNTRGVYKKDDDDIWVSGHPEIERIAQAIESRRLELNKTSGFERLYARATMLYFGGMAKHLAQLRYALRPHAQLAYVVGDQGSYLRVMIRTGQLLAGIAQSLGYELIGTELFRTRLATATREQLREEVILLRWPGR